MRNFFVLTLSISALLLSPGSHAEPGQSVSIPEKVSSNILKRHPTAQEMQATPEIHFGQQLLEVSFKDGNGETLMELFTEKGHLFTNEVRLHSLGEISMPVLDTLRTEFPNYSVQKTELIGNPNGSGEEYDIYLTAGGQRWRVSINDLGTIVDKQHY